jgi:hypothetical protein
MLWDKRLIKASLGLDLYLRKIFLKLLLYFLTEANEGVLS